MVIRTKEDIIERKIKSENRIRECNGDKFTMLGEFINTKTLTEFMCNLCNTPFNIKPEYLFKERKSCNNKECRYRRENTTYKDLETFKKELYDKFGNNFEYIDGFVSYQEYCRLRCNNCGNENFFSKPRSITGKDKNTIYCDKCACVSFKYNFGENKTNEESFIKRFEEKHGKGHITILGEYINNKTAIDVKFHKCGHITSIRPLSIIKFNRCNICSKSSGELFVYELLKDKGIPFEMEKKFEGYNFRFDFYINELDLLIELDGKMHREAHGFVSKNKRNESLEKIQERDRIKDKFCSDNNKKLIRLPYDKNIYTEIFIPLTKILNL